ncbi:MAG TPA: MFS transporter [Patescibacteria group bacterium]|nr:MFS transporter [Patescibacteria group bacterium]
MQKWAMDIKHYFLKDINPVVRFLVLSDVVILGAGGLLGPIFALFIAEFMVGGNEAVAGIAAGIFLFSKSILQIPIAHLLDKIRGEQDDFWMLFVFSIFMGIVPISYLFISTPFQLYITQFIQGLLTAATYPAFMGLFTRHIDKNKEGTEWGIYFTLTDVSGAALAIIGGYVAIYSGFPILIIAVVAISVIGALLLWPIKPYLRLARGRPPKKR